MAYTLLKRLWPLLFILAVILASVNLFGQIDYELDGLHLRLKASMRFPGVTRFVLPPLGQVSANTHRLPLQLDIVLQEINWNRLEGFSPHTEAPHKAALRLFFQIALVAGLGGMMGVFAFPKWRKPRPLLLGFLFGFVLLGILGAATFADLDLGAFEDAKYHGTLAATPWMIDIIQDGLVRIDQLGDQLETLSRNLLLVYKAIEQLPPLGILQSDLILMHVSDIHNNPAAYRFIKEVAWGFGVDVIVDTGDLTDWGTALEAEIIQWIEALDTPYVFVPGNHEAPAVVERLQQTENVYVVTDGSVLVQGITIGGTGDPAAGSNLAYVPPSEELLQVAERIRKAYETQEQRPDIYVVHNHVIAAALPDGLFPIVLHGHTHRLNVYVGEKTLYLDAGTTGAAGLRGIGPKSLLPFSLALLYFHRDSDLDRYALQAVDSIALEGLEQRFSLERIFVDDSRNRN